MANGSKLESANGCCLMFMPTPFLIPTDPCINSGAYDFAVMGDPVEIIPNALDGLILDTGAFF